MSRNNNDTFLNIDKGEQYRAINELIDESKPNSVYYLLLILSSVIIAAGVLLANASILIGGMLVTPVLTPILLIALGLVAGKPRLIKRTFIQVVKSMGVVFIVSLIMTFIFTVPSDSKFFDSTIFNNSLNAAFLYFIVALASGIAATYAWVRREITNILPGISIAVSLVPPISLVAVWMADKDFDRARYFFLIFLFNFIGILMGAMIVFSMQKFYRVDGLLTKRMKEEMENEARERNRVEQPKSIDNEIKYAKK